MKKRSYATLFGFLCLFSTLFAQTLLVKTLPSTAQKGLKDFVWLEGGTFAQGIQIGFDSLQLQEPHRASVQSFYLNRFEITVGEYQEFVQKSGNPANDYDSTVWAKTWSDESESGADKRLKKAYFWHPDFKQYPMVGITWDQAVRYCAWKTEQINLSLEGMPYRVSVRLPTSTEWEYATLYFHFTKDGIYLDRRYYPWDGLFLKLEKDGSLRFNCNGGAIKTPQGNLALKSSSDGFLFTAPVKSFPNHADNLGFFQMGGNVAEWTSDDYVVDMAGIEKRINESWGMFADDPERLKRTLPSFPPDRYNGFKIIKGGSWKDQPFYMQNGVVQIQYPSEANSSTGFRPALVIEKR